MSNNQILAILLIVFGLACIFFGVEKNQPTTAETLSEHGLDLVDKVLPEGSELDYNPPKRGTFLIVIGVLLGLASGGILITEARKKKRGS
jgi:hypothetical protein